LRCDRFRELPAFEWTDGAIIIEADHEAAADFTRDDDLITYDDRLRAGFNRSALRHKDGGYRRKPRSVSYRPSPVPRLRVLAGTDLIHVNAPALVRINLQATNLTATKE
jgi:hypothetical protein